MPTSKNEKKYMSIIFNSKNNAARIVILPITAAVLFICTVLYQSRKDIDILWVFPILIITVISSVIIMIFFIKRSLKMIVKEETLKMIEERQKCASGYEKLLLSDYGIVTFSEILDREKDLSTHLNTTACAVYNYTTLDDTFDNLLDEKAKSEQQKIKEIIKNNIKNGINYKIFFTDKAFIAESANSKLYGKENLIHCKSSDLYNNACFDILLHITPENKRGYVAVNFTSSDGNCENCSSEKTCDYKNDNIFYKEVSATSTNYIYKQLTLLLDKQ